MSTLARMTGKDFEGPAPEIRVPQRPQLTPADPAAEGDAASPSAAAPDVSTDDAVIVGTIDEEGE